MSTSAYILIAAVLILGGVIATVGDRLGTRIGKARLSLFNLRPRKTAVLVTILTGIIISASTLGVLLAASEQFRKMIFEFERIQKDLRRTRNQLGQARQEKTQVEAERDKARTQQETAQRRLSETNRSLKAAVADRTRAEAAKTQAESARTRTEAALNRTQNQLSLVSRQTTSLRVEIRQLQQERQQLIAQQKQVSAKIAERDQEISERDRAIAQREKRLKELEDQRSYLVREVRVLEREAQGLRQGNVAIQRGQVLSSGVVRIVDPKVANQAVDQLLREANRVAIQTVQPRGAAASEQIIQITRPEVEQLINEIDDGQDHVVRILAAANYIVGETPIQVFAETVRNQVVFLAGDVVAASSLDPSTLNDEQLQDKINLLVAASNFRARRAGILSDTVQIGRIETLVRFVEQLKRYNQAVDIKTVAAEVTYTAGPLKIELIAVQDGEILFRTQ